MKTQCPHCGQDYEVDGQYLGYAVDCATCGKTFISAIGRGRYDKTKTVQTPPEQSAIQCPFCGESILAVAKKCKHCGEWLDATEKKAQARQEDNKVNPATYALLGLFLGGIGAHNFYAGEKNKGKNKIGASIISLILLMIGISDPMELVACFVFAGMIGLTVFIFIIYEICNPPKEKYIAQRRVVKINRFVYILLALLLGWLGVHNLYAGQHVNGFVRLIGLLALFCITMIVGSLTDIAPILLFVPAFLAWSVFDICTMPKEKTVYS